MKKLFVLFLLAILPVVASTAGPVKIGNVYYNLDSGKLEAEVTNQDGGGYSGQGSYSGSVTILSSVNYNGNNYKVTSIGGNAFSWCAVTSVTIPNTVTFIGDAAFNGCSSLNSITIPNSVTSIGESAFGYCRGLPSITIPRGVTSIGDYAFYECTGLTSVTSLIANPFEISENVFSGGSYSFTSATLYVPKLVRARYEATPAWNKFQNIISFSGEIKQKAVKIDGIYYNLLSTSEAYVTNSAGGDSSGGGSYSGSVNIPSSVSYNGVRYDVTGIGERAFSVCRDLTSVTLPNSVMIIDQYAFVECSSLTSVTIPNNVMSLGERAFSYCTGLTSITIGNSVTSIGDYAFEQCRALSSLTIPNSVTSIGQYAFYNCNGLFSITIGNSVTSIGYDAFEYCSSLTSVTIPNSVTSIGYGTFKNCTSLTSVSIPYSVTSIGGSAFSGCSGLTSITIPNSVTSIGSGAFFGCSSLESVTIPNSVTSIGSSAFSRCSGLNSVTIGSNVTSIGDYAFYACSNLSCVSSLIVDPFAISEKVFSVDNSSFTSAILWVPSGTMENYRATSGWDKFNFIFESDMLKAVLIDGIYYNLDLEKNEAEVTNRSGGAVTVDGCYSGDVVIPSAVTYEGVEYSVTGIGSAAFSDCYDPISVTIPNSVTRIGWGAFIYCSGLSIIIIPSSVKSIDELAFSGCSSLSLVISLIVNPFEIEENVFDCYNTATLYVPSAAVGKYISTPSWNKFQKMQGIALKGDVNNDGAVDVADIGAIIDVMAKSIYEPAADVNTDKTVDVADIGTVIDIMAGKDVDTPEGNTDTACPDANHPHWIDLSLPSGTKWACCNVGASKPEDSGDYYVFDYALDYNPPSLDQIGELLNNTTSEWITQEGVNGYKFTGTNGNSVFLPAAGYVGSGMLDYVGMYGDYWSSSYTSDGDHYAYRLIFDSTGVSMHYGDCYDRRFVRPVR